MPIFTLEEGSTSKDRCLQVDQQLPKYDFWSSFDMQTDAHPLIPVVKLCLTRFICFSCISFHFLFLCLTKKCANGGSPCWHVSYLVFNLIQACDCSFVKKFYWILF